CDFRFHGESSFRVCNLRRGFYPMLSDFTVTANAIAGTTKKSEKERILAEYLVRLDDASLERAVVWFAGAPFPRREQRVTGVGYATIADAVIEASGIRAEEMWEAWL